MADQPIDRYRQLRNSTAARVALQNSGASLATSEVLAFELAWARARDAVHAPLDLDALASQLAIPGEPVLQVRSRAGDRGDYLRRPDRGRRLDQASADRLADHAGPYDVVIVLGDGLSSKAAQENGPALLAAIREQMPADWQQAPLVVAQQARVALGDEIGELMRARLAVMIIGERPGLSAADSLGIYLTHTPRVGRNDAERNCISNVRPGGQSCAAAVHTLLYLCRESLRLGLTGVRLKDDTRSLLAD